MDGRCIYLDIVQCCIYLRSVMEARVCVCAASHCHFYVTARSYS